MWHNLDPPGGILITMNCIVNGWFIPVHDLWMVSPVFRPWLAASIHTPSSSAPLSSICKLLYKITNSCTTAIFDLEKRCSNPLSLPDGLAGCDWNICRCRFDPLIEHLSIVHLSIELIETFADANSTHWHLHPWGEGGLGTGCLSIWKAGVLWGEKETGSEMHVASRTWVEWVLVSFPDWHEVGRGTWLDGIAIGWTSECWSAKSTALWC